MDQAATTGLAYLRHAFGQMLALVELLDGRLLNERPTERGTNPVGALILHCCSVCEFWLGHVALGRPTNREQDAEFVLLHVIEELIQHLGQMEVTKDVLLSA